MNIYQVMNEAIDLYDDEQAVVDYLIENCEMRDLVPLLNREVMIRMRSRVKDKEQAAFKTKVEAAFAKPINIDDFKPLLGQRISLGGGAGRFTWGEMNVTQLKQRREMLLKIRNGLDGNIYKINGAIDLLESSGEKCLNDLAKKETKVA